MNAELIPDTVTETITVYQLAAGRTIVNPVTGEIEAVTKIRFGDSYASIWTNRTGPNSAYQWLLEAQVDVVTA